MTSAMICSGCEGAGFEEEVAGADAGVAGEAAGGVAGGLHVELARGVGVEDVVCEDAALDEDGAAGGQAFGVEGAGAEAAADFHRQDEVPSSMTVMFSPATRSPSMPEKKEALR